MEPELSLVNFCENRVPTGPNLDSYYCEITVLMQKKHQNDYCKIRRATVFSQICHVASKCFNVTQLIRVVP